MLPTCPSPAQLALGAAFCSPCATWGRFLPKAQNHHLCLQLRSSQHQSSCHKASASLHFTQLLSGNHHAAERSSFRKTTFKPRWSSSLKTPKHCLCFHSTTTQTLLPSHSQRRFLIFPPPPLLPTGGGKFPPPPHAASQQPPAASQPPELESTAHSNTMRGLHASCTDTLKSAGISKETQPTKVLAAAENTRVEALA